MTTTETSTSWSTRLSPRNWPLAWKLVAVGLVPALLAIVLGVLRVSDQARTASQLGTANHLLEVRQRVADTAVALRIERDRSAVFLADNRQGDRTPLTDAVKGTDAAIEKLRSDVPSSATLDQTARNAFEQAQGGFAQLAVLRSQLDANPGPDPTTTLNNYSGVIARADVLDRALLRQVQIPGAAGLADALTATTAASEAVTLQHTVLGAALRANKVTELDRSTVTTADNALAAAYTEYQVALPPGQAPINFITSRENAQRDADKSTILSAAGNGPLSVTPQQWDTDSRAAIAPVDTAGATVAKALADAGNAAEARSSNLAGLNSVLLMLGVLVAATVVVLMSRSLTRSLRVLRTSALDIAGRRLPHAVESIRSGSNTDVAIEPVPLHTRDEIGEVARAFDEVHDQALRLAADQASLQSSVSNMFVNLSRRSQGLVERQLQLIEQLESNEQDPDQLSNLFQLDHLATRMRRNSENLLVLAGTDFAKRNVAPVPLVDVLRAAVSEIEHYQRVVVQAPPQATVVGRSTSDVVHLLAELLDNATSFSPPESQVVISSHRTGEGSILVEIADRGVGMPDNDLADANRRLTTPSAVDVSASRRMGLYVVGRLGARHGITVHLGGSPMGGPGGGLTASVNLPTHLVVGGDGGGRLPRGETVSAPLPAAPVNGAPPNGVPPQRAGQLGGVGQLGRPAPRAPLPATGSATAPGAPAGNGTPLVRPGGLNGLPTRTPGSSLRRDLVSRPDQGTDAPAAATNGAAPEALAVPPQPGSGSLRPQDDPAPPPADAVEGDAAPTGIVPAVDGAPVADDRPAEPAERGEDTAGEEPPAEGPDDPAPEQPGPWRPQPPTGGDTFRDGPVPATPYEAFAGNGENGNGRYGNGHVGNGHDPRSGPRPSLDPDPYGSGRNGGPHTSPVPLVAGLDGPEGTDPFAATTPDEPADALFSASVPSLAEPEGSPRSRRPLAEMRRGPVDLSETTPIFEEIASAWFASQRPVPVDWELGQRPGAEAEREVLTRPPAAPTWQPPGPPAHRPGPDRPLMDRPAPPRPPRPTPQPTPQPAPRPPSVWPEQEASTPANGGAAAPPVPEPAAQTFATAADEGWRAADGAAAERPDELTSAGLPKRRPRARLVPGSAGSAVLAASASPSRSAESVRGRLASYQQGVRQGRENRLRRDPGGAGVEPASTGENTVTPPGGDRDEENR